MNPYECFQNELDTLRDMHLYRSLRVLEAVPDRATDMVWEGKHYTLFCSNDYLGLSHDARVIRAAHEALDHYGVGTGASRLISGTTLLHDQLEKCIARFKRKDAAVVFSSGFLANVGIITTLADENSLIIMDKLNHASLIDAARYSGATIRIYPHNNMKKLEHLLEQSASYERTLIITDSVFSMDGDYALLPDIVALKKKYNALLMIDEAHAVGVFGERGSGLAEQYQCEEEIDIAMGTLSKAVGVLGGYVAGKQCLCDYLRNKARSFIYTTSMPALLCAAANQAFMLIESEPSLRARLWENTHYVRTELAQRGCTLGEGISPIIPVMVGEEERAVACAELLFGEGLYIPAIRYPTVARGKARLRITVSAAHTNRALETLCAGVEKCKDKGLL